MSAITRLKQHVRDNKEMYIVSGTTLVVGIVLLETGSGATANPTAIPVDLIRRGHPGHLIRCIETGEVFASQGRAAKVLGVAKSTLSNHLSGKFPQAGGYTFERLGEWTPPLVEAVTKTMI